MGGEDIWEVVGGADKGGIVVREGLNLTSPISGRLACGAFIRALELREGRVHFRRITGAGPDDGWVTKQLADGRELLVRASEAPAVPSPPGASTGTGGSEEPPKQPPMPQVVSSAPTGGEVGEEERTEMSTVDDQRLVAKTDAKDAGRGVAQEDGPTLHRVAALNARVLAPSGRNAMSTQAPDSDKGYTEIGRLRQGDIVAVKEQSGNWFRLAGWEVLNGWVPPADSGKEVLEPVPSKHEVPVSLLRLRAVIARTERHLVRAEAAGRPWEPLPKDPAYLGRTPTHSIHNPMWGIEARCSAASTALAPPGRQWRVFAARDFAAGDEIERCEVLSAPVGVLGHCQRSVTLSGRVLAISGSREEVLPLGFGALYRQEMLPELATATLAPTEASHHEPLQLVLRAKRDLAVGEELTVYLAADALGRRLLPLPQGRRQEHATRTPRYELPPGGRSGVGSVYAGQSQIHGLGAFAARSFERGEIVELCPFLLLDGQALGANAFGDFRMSFDVGLPACRTPAAQQAALRGFGKDIDPVSLWWPPRGDDRPPRISGLAMGSGPLYNHAAKVEDHNLWWSLHPGLGAVVMQAKKFIRKDSEIFIDYGGTYWQGRKLRPK